MLWWIGLAVSYSLSFFHGVTTEFAASRPRMRIFVTVQFLNNIAVRSYHTIVFQIKWLLTILNSTGYIRLDCELRLCVCNDTVSS